MTITEAHYQFKLNMDRIDSLSTEDFNLAEIDWLLNEAALVFLKRRTSVSNKKQKGFEADQKRIDDLSTLVIKYPLQPGIIPTLVSGVYEMKLADLSFKYFQLVAISADVTVSANCIKKLQLKFIQHDDYIQALKDPFNSPSQEFLPYNFGRSSDGVSTSVYIYPGQLSVNTVYPEYIKYPQKVSFGNYTYIDGVIYPPTTFDFPEHTHNEIIDIACEIAAMNIESPEYIQLKTQKVFSHE